MALSVLDRFAAQIGELAQHQLSNDPAVAKTSEWYYGFLTAVLNRHKSIGKRKPPRYLEIACYRHILGYKLAKDRAFDATQFDICDRDLELGRELALSLNLPDVVDRVAGDFHSLPFADNYFDFVMVSASIHHTRSPNVIIEEAMRVLTDGGLFYCQREPCERLFCFYQFNANRPEHHTPFEAHLHKRDVMRLISSPYPGARNAEMFGRVENDRIPLEMYYDVFNRHGRVLEEVLYFDGLLTAMDKRILEQEGLPEKQLADFIEKQIADEIELASPVLSEQDRLLGYSLPSPSRVRVKAEAVAAALRARPANKKTVEWQKAMVKIFGGSLRFVAERQRAEKTRSNVKFRRDCPQKGYVKLDRAVYESSGLFFWEKMLPDIQTAPSENLYKSSFPDTDWTACRGPGEMAIMVSQSPEPILTVNVDRPALAALRYRVVVDDELPAARVKIVIGNKIISEEVVAQNEDRMARFLTRIGRNDVRFILTDLKGQSVATLARVRVSILQCIPVSEVALSSS